MENRLGWFGAGLILIGLGVLVILYLSGGEEKEPVVSFAPIKTELTFMGLPEIDKGHYSLWRLDSNVYTRLDVEGGISSEAPATVILTQEPTDDTQFELTIEEGSGALSPSGPLVLRGNWTGDRAEIRFPVNLNSAQGTFLLATPTNGAGSLESSGVWFYDLPNKDSSLKLDPAPDGWVYEGWIEHRDQVLSTGRFKSPNWPDDSGQFSGSEPAYAFPGEDFLAGRPGLLTPPLYLRNSGGSKVFISLEPDIDGVDPSGKDPWGMVFLSGEVVSSSPVAEAIDLAIEQDFATPIGKLIAD